ncbi:MAG TPA: homoserine kinase [Nitriliruptorales bacterium]
MRHHAVRVPATTANLGPGFDAFGAAVSLGLVAVSGDRRDDRVTTEGQGAGEIPTGDDNLVWRSFVALCEARGADVPDISLLVRNPIPLERGLGSSSAAIVAGLALARLLTAAPVGDRELVALATDLEGHPDNVAPAILGGITVTAWSDDGELVIRRAQPHPRLRPVLLVPTDRQNTNEARGVLPEHLDKAQVSTQAARAGHVLGALLGGWPADPRLAGDVLHEPPRLQVMVASGDLVRGLRAAGVHAWLSGAGPSIAAAIPRRDAVALAFCRGLGEQHGFEVHELDWDLSGLLPCPVDAASVDGAG